jgi:hypothetical protein
VNDHENLSFIVDTGSNYSIVFTDSLLQLPSLNKLISIQGFGSTDSIVAKVSIGNSVSISGLIAEGKQLLAIEKGKIRLQQFYDRPIHGVIGLDMLRHYDMEINFRSSRIILRKPGAKDKNNRRWKKLPFDLNNNALILPAIISTSNYSSEPMSLVLDTGSDLPLLLQEQYCPTVSKPTIIGMGILGFASGRIGIIEKIKIGDLEIKNIITAFPDSASSRWNLFQPQQGNLGIQFLRRYRVIVNYKENYIQLKAINKLIDKAFHYNQTGIAIDVSGNDNCSYIVSQVAPDSPAAISGLMKGDKIISIGQTLCSNLSLEIINKYFFDNKISRLEIMVQREFNFMKFTLKF